MPDLSEPLRFGVCDAHVNRKVPHTFGGYCVNWREIEWSEPPRPHFHTETGEKNG